MEHLETDRLGPSLALTHRGWALSHLIIQPGDRDEVEEEILVSTIDSISADMTSIPTYPFHLIGIFPLGKELEAKGFFPIYFHIVTESFTGHPSVSKNFNLNIRKCRKITLTLDMPSLENWRGQDGS